MSYKACVETSWHNPHTGVHETSIECGHKHRTIEAAVACGKKNYASRYVNGSWTACAAWHNWTVQDQDGKRVDADLIARAEYALDAK